MNISNLGEIRNSIDNLRRCENELFSKLHSEPTRKEEILKIKKHQQKQHRLIQHIINNLQSLYDVQIIIEELEKKK